MLTLTNPSALLALLGLLVPLAIHLWNRRPGREVAVGSLRWLAAGANRRLRNLRLEQVLLLLLRAALLAVLALALANLSWRQPRPAAHGQVLLSPALAGELAAQHATIDSLRRRGYGLRWLAAGFPAITTAAWRADSAGQAAGNKPVDTGTYWSRVQQAGATFAGQPLYVLTPAALGGFGGTHPALPAGLTWQILPTRQATTWLQSATATADSLRLLVGRADEAGLTFEKRSVAQPIAGNSLKINELPAFTYIAATLRPQPTTASRQPTVPVTPATLRVWVYAPAGAATEARYLKAALQAAALGLPGRLALTVAPTLPDTATRPDWLFWLGEAPVPAAWRGQVRQGLHLWQPAAGPGAADTATLVASATTDAQIAIWRRGRGPLAGQPLWADSHDHPVLTQQPLGTGAIYTLATRLNPTWSALSGSSALPELLLSVLVPPLTATDLAPHDQRRFDAAQLPASAGKRLATSALPAAADVRSLQRWLVLAAGLLFALERWLARRLSFTTPAA